MILVTGAAGKTGLAVLRELAARGASGDAVPVSYDQLLGRTTPADSEIEWHGIDLRGSDRR